MPMRVEYWYRPHRANGPVEEKLSPHEPSGGTFWVYLHNAARQPRGVSSIQLNGRDIESIPYGKGLNWYRLTHELIPPRTTAMLILNLQRSFLERAPIELGVWLSDGTRHTIPLEPTPSPAVIAGAWLEGRTLTLVVRNDGGVPAQIVRLRVDGRNLRFRALAPEAEPNGGLTVLKAALPATPEPYRSLPLQVEARVGNRMWMVGGAVRPLNRVFPIGASGAHVWHNDAERRAGRERGLDTFVYDALNEPLATERRVFGEICPRENIYALPQVGFARSNAEFLDRNRTNPHIIAFMLNNAQEAHLPELYRNRPLPALYERAAKMIRDRQAVAPIGMNIGHSHRLGEFAEIPDIVCYGAGYATEPMPASADPSWGVRLEWVAAHTQALRLSCEPLPFWAWAWGAHPQDERAWVDGALGRACPTPEEIRVQLWLQLSRGAKGVLWHTEFNAEAFRRHYLEAKHVPALRILPEAERAQAVEQLAQHGHEALEELTRLNRFLQSLRNALLQMEWRPNGVRVLSASNPQRLDAALLVGEGAATVWLTNLDYEAHPQGYRFRTQREVEVEVLLPRWLRPRRATLRESDGTNQPLQLQPIDAQRVRLRIEAMPQQVALVWLE